MKLKYYLFGILSSFLIVFILIVIDTIQLFPFRIDLFYNVKIEKYNESISDYYIEYRKA